MNSIILKYLYKIIYFYLLIRLIESRRTLENYIVSHNYISESRRDQFSIYDQREDNLLCRINSLLSSDYLFNRINNLITYPSSQRIASIENLWSPFIYKASINIYDDELNQWTIGKIYQVNRLKSYLFKIEYRNKYYIMENKYGSTITEIRDEKNSNYILTRFYQTSFSQKSPNSKYKIEIYKNDLPHPLYILSLYALDSIKFNNYFFKFLPFRNNVK